MMDETKNFVILYGQPGTGIRTTGPQKRNRSLRFLRDFKNYDLYYGSVSHLPEWVDIPKNFWAYDMGGFYCYFEIRNALQKVSYPSIILSYVPFNGDKAYETVDVAIADNLPFVLVYKREDKANFLDLMREHSPVGLCDDSYENCKYVFDKGFTAIHCIAAGELGVEENDYSGILLAKTTDELILKMT